MPVSSGRPVDRRSFRRARFLYDGRDLERIASASVPAGAWMPDLFAVIVPGGLKNGDMARVEKFAGVEKALPVAVEQVKLAGDLTGSRKRKNVIRQDNVVFMGLDVAAAYEGREALCRLFIWSRTGRVR